MEMDTKLLKVCLNKFRKVLVCSKRLYGSQRKNISLFFVSICLIATIDYFTRRNGMISLNDTHRLVQYRLREYNREEKGTGCSMPKLDPFSAEAMKFNKNYPKIICEGIDWVNCNKSECYVVEEMLNKLSDISCNYRDILYVNDEIYFVSDYIKVRGDEKYILNRSDHVKISCSGSKLYSDKIHFFRWFGYKAGFRPVATQPMPADRQDSYNVMILAFDSTSHNGFIRKMPKSYKYLSKRAVFLNGYNIVGDGTPAALFALLTGYAEDEIPDARKKLRKRAYLDNRMFIFDLLKNNGYRTAYFEDSPRIGTFQHRFNGFRRQPADHYLRAFFTEKSRDIISYVNYSEPEYCVGAVPQYQLMIDLSEEFLQLDGKKFCFTMIADICHDDFNLISTADEALVSFLENLIARGQLEDTLVLIMGDHGSRFQPIRETYQGKIEERLPLMAILLPERLKRLQLDALKILKYNSDVLTTPFDIHSTLLDVLDLKSEINDYKVPGSDIPRAMSLLKPIPKTRSCSEAGILQHWCACTKWFPVPRTNLMYNHIGNVLYEYIDGISEEQRSKCAKRKLISIESVLQQNVNTQLLKYGYDKDEDAFLGNPKHTPPKSLKEYYQAKVILSPGRAVFEGTMMYNTQSEFFSITSKDISRINAYGDEPKCISSTHPHLIKYCYCKDKLKNTVLNESNSHQYTNDHHIRLGPSASQR